MRVLLSDGILLFSMSQSIYLSCKMFNIIAYFHAMPPKLTIIDTDTLVDVFTETGLSSHIFAKSATSFVYMVKLAATKVRAQRQ
jgi:hypothetical protein